MTEPNESVAESDEELAGAAPEGVAADPDPAAEAAVQRDKLKDQLLRTAADFDNFRKRTKRDLNDAAARSREELLRELLPVFDNLERAVDASKNATDAQSVADGVAMVLKQFEDVGGRMGIERVQCVGERFDPQVHDAVQQIESADHPPGTIVAEIVPGYRMRDRLVRPAMVVVARPPAAAAPSTPAPAASAEAEGDGEADGEES